jgi:hypothetical protein
MMNTVGFIARRLTLGLIVAFCSAVLGGCVYDVPITAQPTRKVDPGLLGDWTSKDGKDKMKVVRLDDGNYIVSYNGDLYRAYHSDVDQTAFFSVQILGEVKPKYAYSAWTLSDDGALHGRTVSDKVVPDETKDSASVRKLLKKNLHNPALFESETQFTKDK